MKNYRKNYFFQLNEKVPPKSTFLYKKLIDYFYNKNNPKKKHFSSKRRTFETKNCKKYHKNAFFSKIKTNSLYYGKNCSHNYLKVPQNLPS